MKGFLATKSFAVLDIVLQLLLFSSNLGIFVWNRLQVDVHDQCFSEFGDGLLYTGIVSALISIELDVFLLIFVAWQCNRGLYWWSLGCLGLATLSWIAYMTLSIYFQSLFLGLWAFGYLYSRATLLMIAKADFVGIFQSKDFKRKDEPPCVFSSAKDLPLVSEVLLSTPTLTTKEKNKDANKSPSLPLVRLFADIERATVEESVDMARNSLTFCTFLGNQDEVGSDHYIARNESVIMANEESVAEELKTKL